MAKFLLPIIQKYIAENNIDTYYEPFVGGANVIDKIECNHKIGSDAILEWLQSESEE